MASALESARSRLVYQLQSGRLGVAFAFVLGMALVMSVIVALQSASRQWPASSNPVASALLSNPPLPATTLQSARTAGKRNEEPNIEAVVDATARKYRISSHAMREYVDTAYLEARRNQIDPLLVIAVMAVESRFNPIAQSDFGATGLMQVVPRYHTDKFSASRGESVLDPRTNIKVGARVLREYVARGGNEAAGLQLYNGSSGDRHNTYATRVLAERERLRSATLRGRARVVASLGVMG